MRIIKLLVPENYWQKQTNKNRAGRRPKQNVTILYGWTLPGALRRTVKGKSIPAFPHMGHSS